MEEGSAEGSKGAKKFPLERTINIEDFLERPFHFPLQKTKLEHDQAPEVTSLIVVVFFEGLLCFPAHRKNEWDSIKTAQRSQG